MQQPVLTDADYAGIAKIVYEHSRISLGAGKKELVASRLGKRLRVLGCRSYRDYRQVLEGLEGGEEINQLVDAISTNHTFFFREKKHFEFLEQAVLPEFHRVSAFRRDGCFRVWSAASSTGEEPYSIAMTLAMHGDRHPGFRWSMECTDISRTAVESAREGIYPNERTAEMDPLTRKRFFQRGIGSQSGKCRVKSELRDRIAWHVVNLFQEAYPFDGRFHVIFCRNVMIYFDRPSQEWLVQRLAGMLVPGGYLKVGHSESLANIRHGLVTVQPAVYRKPPK
jgi:chemotaxis protein methyltransferase CheR